MQRLLDSLHNHLTPYDRVRSLAPEATPGLRAANRIALLLLLAFIAVAGALVLGGFIDNKPTTASTGLVSAHRMVSLDPAGWFAENIWWRGKQTPTPLPFTIHGAFFALFGYSIRGILCLHILVGALAAGLLYRVAARRYGPPAGLLALLLYLAAPLPLHVTFSGWTFVWATFFLLLAIDLLDRAVLAKSIPRYLLAGLALGCAGMSRPENYAVAALVFLFVNIPLRYRAAFLFLAFLYPLAQYAHNNLYLGDGPALRILDDARADMGYADLFREWFGSVRRHILDRNFAAPLQWLLVPALLFFGVPRNRFLTAVLAYFALAFFAAYAMRRISFNHEGYYYVHVALALPFLAALLAWLAARGAAAARKLGMPRRAARAAALLALAAALAGNAYTLRDTYASQVLYRAPEPVREVRDFLNNHLEPGDRIALDYFREVSWMIAEIEGPAGRDLYFYDTNPTGVPRPPVNAARKDIGPEERAAMNAWVKANYTAWRESAPPRYLVTQSDAAWLRERDRPHALGHYTMYSLRPAFGIDTALGKLLQGRVVFENEEFLIIEGEP